MMECLTVEQERGACYITPKYLIPQINKLMGTLNALLLNYFISEHLLFDLSTYTSKF